MVSGAEVAVHVVPGGGSGGTARGDGSRDLAGAAASTLLAQLMEAAPAVRELVAGDVVRVVGGSVDQLARVAGDDTLRRGFLAEGGRIERHVALEPLAGVASASVAMSLASFALGCYWEQRVSAQLQRIESHLGELVDAGRIERDAAIAVAWDDLRQLRAQPVGSRIGGAPAAIVGAQEVMHDRRLWLTGELADRAQALRRRHRGAVPLTAYLEFLEQHRVEQALRQYVQGAVIDLEFRRLQALDADQQGHGGLEDAIAAIVEERRAQLGSVSMVVGGLLGTSVVADRSGWGEHLNPLTHGGRLAGRRRAVVAARDTLRVEERLLLGLNGLLPDPRWSPGPATAILTVGAQGAATGWLELGTVA